MRPRTTPGARRGLAGALVLAAGLVGAPGALAQAPGAPADTLELGRLYDAALRRDARARQAELAGSALELRLGNLAAEWLPRFRLRGEARYQSDVPHLEPEGPTSGDAGDAGAPLPAVFPEVPKDRYEAALSVEQVLYDGTIGGRRGVERARTDEERAHLEGTLYALRREVDGAFFAALAARARHAETTLLLEDLEVRLAQARAAVRAGVRLPGDAATLEAEVLGARQRAEALEAERRAALAVLAALTGLPADERSVLASPDLAAAVSTTRARIAAAPAPARPVDDHPQLAAFDRTAERLSREAALAERVRRPRLVAFGEAGYGRPGLNQFGDAWDAFWLGGVRLEWAPWNWGRVDREVGLLEVRREVVETERDAFAAMLERAAVEVAEDLDRLEAALATDDDIVRLRSDVERQESRRFEEGVITAADYVRARTELEQARVARRLHRVELAAARARYLTILGVPIP